MPQTVTLHSIRSKNRQNHHHPDRHHHRHAILKQEADPLHRPKILRWAHVLVRMLMIQHHSGQGHVQGNIIQGPRGHKRAGRFHARLAHLKTRHRGRAGQGLHDRHGEEVDHRGCAVWIPPCLLMD